MNESRDACCPTEWIEFEHVMVERLPWLRRPTKTCFVATTCSLLITAYTGESSHYLGSGVPKGRINRSLWKCNP